MKPYTHFTLTERNCLQQYLSEGKSYREIARLMDRSPSTISREIKRNFSKKKKRYNAWRATVLYIIRRRHCVRKPIIEKDSELYTIIKECLEKYWTPEQIQKHCERIGLNISFSTIYKYIKIGWFADITAKTHLRRRGKRKYSREENHATIHPDRTIHQRSLIIEERQRLGDWEGDTICSSKGTFCLVTQVDRKSRLLAAALSPNHTKEAVRKAIKRAFELLEVQIPIHSITLDNGSEFADYKGVEKDLDTTIYFADPHSPWQRGTNENTNGILRFFFPKGTDFSLVTENEVLNVVRLINSRPRKCLDFISPIDFISKKCCT